MLSTVASEGGRLRCGHSDCELARTTASGAGVMSGGHSTEGFGSGCLHDSRRIQMKCVAGWR